MLGWLLIGYAAVGAVLLMAAIIVGGPVVSRLEGMAGSATGSVRSAAAAAEAAADAFDGFDESLSEARSSTADAAAISRETAVTLQGLSDAMSISVFGSQPLLPLADEFARSADQLDQMGTNLDGIGQALVTNKDDVVALAARLRNLSVQLNSWSEAVADPKADADPTPPLTLLFYGFVAWQLLAVLASGAAGTILLRGSR